MLTYRDPAFVILATAESRLERRPLGQMAQPLPSAGPTSVSGIPGTATIPERIISLE